MSKKTTNREWAVKYKLVRMFGGKCQRCPYDDLSCLSVFEFHHKDRTTKDFQISRSVNSGMAWDDIVAEAAKCELLCVICHRKLESKDADLDADAIFNDFLSSRRVVNKINMIQDRYGMPAKDELVSLLKENSAAAVARMFGKTPSTVTYWKKLYDIPTIKLNKSQKMPTKHELSQLISTISAGQIGLIYGVSDKAVKKWLQKYGIDNPRNKYYRPTKIDWKG